MSTIPTEVTTHFAGVQNQVWQSASLAVSEALGAAATFSGPSALTQKTSELYGEFGAPMLVVQFAFASLPECPQLVLATQGTVLALASAIKGERVVRVDEAVLADVRPTFEALVQGLCVAVAGLRNEAVVPTGLTVRYQILSFPPALAKAAELLRCEATVSIEDPIGPISWLIDRETACHVLALGADEDGTTHLFGQTSEGSPTGPTLGAGLRQSDSSSLDLLMDIPLEISVELGRVRMLVKEVVELGAGSIVEIDKAAGEPVDILVNGRLVARGEVVVIEDNFGVRITEIMAVQDRLSRLGDAA